MHYNKQGKRRHFYGVLTALINAVLELDGVFKNVVHGAVLARVVLSMDGDLTNVVHTFPSTALLVAPSILALRTAFLNAVPGSENCLG